LDSGNLVEHPDPLNRRPLADALSDKHDVAVPGLHQVYPIGGMILPPELAKTTLRETTTGPVTSNTFAQMAAASAVAKYDRP
jgi:hypothetical protein